MAIQRMLAACRTEDRQSAATNHNRSCLTILYGSNSTGRGFLLKASSSKVLPPVAASGAATQATPHRSHQATTSAASGMPS
jgi:hypothetical protein